MDNNLLNGLSLDVEATEREKLKLIFPECFTEGKLDIDKLLNMCGEYITDDFERYEFKWKGKSKCFQLAQSRSTGTLRSCEVDSVNWDTTKNAYIEGDNLEVLKLLQTSYYRKVKMIYIDPPYNTGNDFVYPDNFADSIENYKAITSGGMRSNSETTGRYHTNWLNMMYPRLRLAKNLLKDDGVMFISIDDNEVTNLRKLCDEVFGEDNFVGEIIRKTKSMTNDVKSGFNIQHEYIIVYARNIESLNLVGEYKDFDSYSNPDNDPNGDWCSGDPSAKSGGDGTYFEIENPITGRVDLPPQGRYWGFSKDSLKKYIESGKIKFKTEHKENERGFIFKRYKNDLGSLNNPVNSLFADENQYMNQNSTKELNNLLGNSYFDYPKPVELIKKLINYSTSSTDNDIILDFFSGSATTAHAVMQLNAEDGGNRRFICVQLPEPTDEKSEAFKAGYKNICEIGKERIRRAGAKIKEETKPTLENPDITLGTGFRVFKLDSSNLKIWDNSPIVGDDLITLEERLRGMLDLIKKDRTNLDVVYEVMLKLGQDLCEDVIPIELDNKTVYGVGANCLFVVCLAQNVTEKTARQIAEYAPARIIFADQCFDNVTDKSNVKLTLRSLEIDMKVL